MKTILLLALIGLSNVSFSQSPKEKSKTLLTSKYTGTYSYGKDFEKERTGIIYVYPETDSTILFFIDLNRGPRSFNMGSLYGRALVRNDEGIFDKKLGNETGGCKWSLLFTNKSLAIRTIQNNHDCSMGHGVFADGDFKLISNKLVDHFEDQEGSKTYFSKTKPEAYYTK